jgi:ATP-dependent DNA ligase
MIDGYRAQLHIHRGHIRCIRAAAITGPSSSVRSRAAEALSADDVIIDGEADGARQYRIARLQALRRDPAKKTLRSPGPTSLSICFT